MITDYRYDSFGRRTHTVERTKWGMRTIYDGLSFEVVKEGETTPDSRGITTTGSGDANLYNYNPHGSEHTRGTRYYFIRDRGQELRTDKNGEALPDRTKGVRTYLYLNGERVAINNLYNTNHGQYYYGSDILGSVRFITGQNGQELNRIEYDIFGGIYKGNSPYGLETGYTGKPYDSVTGLSDYGFRDYSPAYARFMTEDPIRDGENWFSYVGNNPVNFIDPWGLEVKWVRRPIVTEKQFNQTKNYLEELINSDTEVGRRLKELSDTKEVTVTVNVNTYGPSNANAVNWDNASNGTGSSSIVNLNIIDTEPYRGETVKKDIRATIAHEIGGHAYDNYKGTSPYNGSTGKGRWPDLFKYEQNAVAMENETRNALDLPQRKKYNNNWDMPVYNSSKNQYYVQPGDFPNGVNYRSLPGDVIPWQPSNKENNKCEQH